MLFNSLHFFLYFPLVTGAYFVCPPRWRWALLLVASCYFYMALIPAYILILFGLIAVDYVAALVIHRTAGATRKAVLVASLLANVGVLFGFKYFNFVNENLAALFRLGHLRYPIPLLDVVLPVGLSFHTFQSMSYTLEVYRGEQEPERHLGIYALYVLFYPQLVAGPIERPQNLLHQFRATHAFDAERASSGLRLMLWGLAKKIVVADRLAAMVNRVYGDLPNQHGFALVVAMYFFAFQIYCDFSGYSDVARGAARVMGFDLMANFDRPYRARTIAEFWRRWHISLSTWFRDYVYVPLGGNRVSEPRRYRNLFAVFLLSGLWHGANWTFVVWGALHGSFLVFARVLERPRAWLARAVGLGDRPRLAAFLEVMVTFHLVTLAWVFFRAPTVHEAWYVLTHWYRDLGPMASIAGAPRSDLVVAIAAIAAMMVGEWANDRLRAGAWLAARPMAMRWAAYYLAIGAIVVFGEVRAQPFIYFQF